MGTKRRARRTVRRARWLHTVKTVSTHPPGGLFTQDAETIARVLATKRVSPKGIGSGIRMLQFFLNRGGSGLAPARRRVLERAKRLLQQRNRAHAHRGGK